jgi:single-strand DNA-binding protein
VEGRLQLRNYVGKDGNKHYVTEVIADRIEFIERRSSGTNPAGPKPTGGTENKTEEKTGMESFGSNVGFDEEIPF